MKILSVLWDIIERIVIVIAGLIAIPIVIIALFYVLIEYIFLNYKHIPFVDALAVILNGEPMLGVAIVYLLFELIIHPFMNDSPK